MGNRANQGHHGYDRSDGRRNSDLESARRKLRTEHQHEFRKRNICFLIRVFKPRKVLLF